MHDSLSGNSQAACVTPGPHPFRNGPDVVRKDPPTIQIEVVFPSEKFNLWGRVVRARRVPAQLISIMESGMGIKFIDSDDEWQEKFAAWKAGKG